MRGAREIGDAIEPNARHIGSRRGHDRAHEAESLRFREPAADLRNLAHFAAEPELADHDGVGTRPRCRRRRSRWPSPPRGLRPAPPPSLRPPHSQRCPGPRARRPRAAARSRRASPGDHRRTTARRAAASAPASRRPAPAPRRTAAACLRARAATTEPDAPTRRSARNSALGIGDREQPLAGHLHQPELVGGSEPVLQRAQHAQRVVPIAFEGEHGVDDVLERARPGERTVLGDVTDRAASRCRGPWRAAAPRSAPSRTWLTDPGPPGASGSWTAWIESIAITSGRIASACAHTSGSDVSHTTSRSGASVPSRSARRRTCAADSSAHTSRQRAPSAAIAPSACSTSVLLPIPGSPPTSVSDPATRPPPSTRSSSGTFVGRRGAPSGIDVGERHRPGRRAAADRAPRRGRPRRPRASPTPRTAGSARAISATRARTTVHRYRTSVRVMAAL